MEQQPMSGGAVLAKDEILKAIDKGSVFALLHVYAYLFLQRYQNSTFQQRSHRLR